MRKRIQDHFLMSVESGGEGGGFQPITSQAELDRIVQARVAREKDKQGELSTELEAEKQKVKELEAAQQRATDLESELTQARQSIADLESNGAEKDKQILKLKVAGDKRVPAHRINGETEEELVADADRYLTELQGQTGGNGAAHIPESGTGGEQPRTGTLQSGRERALARLGKAEAN